MNKIVDRQSPAAQPALDALADVQASPDARELSIEHVGIKALKHPFTLIDRANKSQATVASCDLGVALPHHVKGTHMSRFVDLLNQHGDALSTQNFDALLHDMLGRLGAESGEIRLSFPFFVNKTAPVSGVQSLMDYPVTLIGRIDGNAVHIQIQVVVAATSLCPCSKEIADYGAHNQRSHITLTAEIAPDKTLWIQDLIDLAESEASAELYAVLKRPDEKLVTEGAYDNPKFVEDLVRDIAGRMTTLDAIAHYTVEAENFESIHNHSAYARISG